MNRLGQMHPSGAGGLARFAPSTPVLLLLSLAIFACSEPPLDESSELIEITPELVSFGDVTVGTQVERTLLIRNRGRSTIGAEALEIPRGLKVEPASVQLGPGSQAAVSLIFEAGAVDLVGAIQWGTSQGEAFSTEVEGRSITSPFTMVSSVAFGAVQVGDAKAVDIEILSLVDHELELNIQDPENRTLHWSDSVVFLPARGSHWVSLTYSPSRREVLEEVLLLQGCIACDPFELSVSGSSTGRDFQVTPGGLDFGIVPVGLPEIRNLRIENTGNVPLDLDAMGARPPFELVVDAEGYTLQPGEVAILPVRFNPTEGGLRGVTFRVKDRGSPLARDVLLRGTGGSRLVGIPNQIDFGVVYRGFPLRRTLQLQNVGLPRTIEIVSVGFGNYSPAFRVVDQKVGRWIGATALPLEIEFRSYEDGVFVAELLVRTSDESQLLKIPLRGEVGEVPHVEECKLGFHPKAIHAGLVRSKRVHHHKVVIANEGSVPCFLREIDWNIAQTYVDPVLHPFEPVILAPGETTTVEVTALNLLGNAESWYTLDLLLGGQLTPTHSIEYLSYSSVLAPIATPTQLFFEPLPVGAQETRVITIADLDAGTTVRSIALSEDSHPSFTLVNADEIFFGDLADGLAIEVGYSPGTNGYQHGQVVLHLTDFDEPMLIDVVGVGLDPSP